MNDSHKYSARGVSATKDDVHKAIKNLDKGLFPNAFCKIMPDYVAGDESFCNIMHADTAGTKGSLAYMYWKETGDISVWRGIAQDAIVMNVDDMACVGAVDNIILSSTIGRNYKLIPGAVISEIIESCNEFIQLMHDNDVAITLAGGETADVGDIVRTIDVGYTTFARIPRKELVVNDIKAGQVIVGFASYGKSTYETAYNGGMGSNGLTSGRHDVFHHSAGVDMGKLVLSPTRTYLPLIKKALASCKAGIHGIIHCSGGAQTKVMKFVNNVHIIKDSMFDIPPLFRHIQEESGTDIKEMYQVFNMGHRLEMYVDENVASELIEISKSFEIDAKIIGRVEASAKPELTLVAEGNTLSYTHF